MKKYIRQHRFTLAWALVCILLSTAFAVMLQFIKGDLLDVAIAGDVRRALSSGLWLLVLILLEIAFFFGYRRLGARFVVGCTRALKADLFASILRRSYVQFKARTQGEYIAKYTNGADLIRDRLFSMLPTLIEILLKILLVSVSLFYLDVRIALITLLLLTTPLYVPRLIQRRLQGAQAAYVKAVEANLTAVNDWLAGFEVIKNFSIERRIMERFGASSDAAMDALLRDRQLGNVAQLLTTLISYLSHFIILAYAAYLVLAGAFSAGGFFVAVSMIDQLSYPLISLSGVLRQIVAARPGCAAMERFIADGEETSARQGPTSFIRAIRMEDVSFAYDGGEPLLRHFSLTIERGKRYLLEGPSGSGKTTVVNLLLRYFDADAGSIAVDGVPIARFDSTYGLITVVRQEATLFHDTLRNNLTLYRDIDDERLIGLLHRLGLSKYAGVEALDRMVTEGGANLSGGEKKRVCLARALLRDTPLLILDEPLANLDDATAGRIEALLLAITDRTLLVVSHQFSREHRALFDAVVKIEPASA